MASFKPIMTGSLYLSKPSVIQDSKTHLFHRKANGNMITRHIIKHT